MKYWLSILLCSTVFTAVGQTAVITGKVTDPEGKPIESATVAIINTAFGTTTTNTGIYRLEVSAATSLSFIVSYTGYDQFRKTLNLKAGQTLNLDVTLKGGTINMTEAVKRDERVRYEGGLFLDVANANIIPSTTDGITAMIKIVTGTNNELTSQYSVRGGNYDENLVYVNDFEINRPFLVRSGQQEGLSFVNADLAQSVYFSLGGFGARYGDKMSSVLDVTYKRPQKFEGSASASLLGFNAYIGNCSKD